MTAIMILTTVVLLALSSLGIFTRAILSLFRRQWGSAFYQAALAVMLFLLAGMILPAATFHSGPSHRVRCISNLSKIGKAMKLYSMDHQDNFPQDIARIINYENYIRHPGCFVCPESGHIPGPLTNLCEWTDYVYVAGLTEADPSESVQVFCPSENHEGKGVNVLFLDGSYKWYPIDEFVLLTNNPSLFFGTSNQLVLADIQGRTKLLRGHKQIKKKP